MTNKVLIAMIKRIIDDQPRKWHEPLSEVLWVYRNSKNKATCCECYVVGFDDAKTTNG